MNNTSKSQDKFFTSIIYIILALTIICLIVPVVQATIEFPPNNDIFFQTTGEQGDIGVGDYYSSIDGDNIRHQVGINIPCLASQTFRLDLFDPELYDAGAPGVDELVDDEVRPRPPDPDPPVGDQTNFILFGPNGATVVEATFGPHDPAGPPPASHDNWVPFHTIILPPSPVSGDTCGRYTLEIWTGDGSGVAERNDDDNAWKHRILGNPDASGNETFDPDLGPDGRPGTGDEVWLDAQLLSYQHNTVAAQSFLWFVDDRPQRIWIGRNFDMDLGTDLCNNVPCDIVYVAPSGATFPATISGNSVWNPGQPDRGSGDVFVNSEPGLWRADVLMPVNNQYIIEIENEGKPLFIDPPILPDVFIVKDDGVVLVESPSVTTYTIAITNAGPGAAFPIPGPEVVDTLPAGMTFAGCGIVPPLEGTCAESAPGSGVVHFELRSQTAALDSSGAPFGSILAYLPGVSSGLMNTGALQVVANIQPDLPDSFLLTNTVQIDWTDAYNNIYSPRSDDDIDTVALQPNPEPSVSPSPSPTSTPDPTSTPQPTSPRSTPPPPTITPGTATPVSIFASIPGATATVFPVTFLPETGAKEVKSVETARGGAWVILVIVGVGAGIVFWRRRLRKKI